MNPWSERAYCLSNAHHSRTLPVSYLYDIHPSRTSTQSSHPPVCHLRKNYQNCTYGHSPVSQYKVLFYDVAAPHYNELAPTGHCHRNKHSYSLNSEYHPVSSSHFRRPQRSWFAHKSVHYHKTGQRPDGGNVHYHVAPGHHHCDTDHSEDCQNGPGTRACPPLSSVENACAVAVPRRQKPAPTIRE